MPAQNEIYLPIRLIATEDEDTKNAIIEATNSQTPLKSEQKAAMLPVQKALEQYYVTKRKKNNFPLYYERRTEQYRDDNIPKAKIITIPTQIKTASALFFDLPHEVSGQYGKVAKKTKGLLFGENDFEFLNSYYVSGLAWYKVERFVQSHDDGKKYRRARWHLIMLLKYLLFPIDAIDEIRISKKVNKNSNKIEEVLLRDADTNIILEEALEIIKKSIAQSVSLEEALSDRKTFERKETTVNIIDCVTALRKIEESEK